MLSWAKSTNSGYNYQNKTVSCCFNGVSVVHALAQHERVGGGQELQGTARYARVRLGRKPVVLIKVKHEGESVATLNVGEARVFRELVTCVFKASRMLMLVRRGGGLDRGRSERQGHQRHGQVDSGIQECTVVHGFTNLPTGEKGPIEQHGDVYPGMYIMSINET
ncbi:hypothetical protein PR003_g29335, partial [Phytophthora rubi]